MSSPTIELMNASALLRECSDAFDGLAGILETIKAEADPHSRLSRLAAAGLFITREMAEGSGSWSEQAERAAQGDAA